MADSSTQWVTIFGAGMAGLAAAVRAVELGHPVRLFEAAGQAGGRCRSFFDDRIGRHIDNGNHLILGGNRSIFAYLETVGGMDELTPVSDPVFPFVETPSGTAWTVRPGGGPIPWWMAAPGRGVPGTGFRDLWDLLRLQFANPSQVLTDCVSPSRAMFRRFWQPLCQAVLNTDASEGAAVLIQAMMSETLQRGGTASQPYLTRRGLSPALVEPGVRYLEKNGAAPTFSRRLRQLKFDGGRVTACRVGEDWIDTGPDETVILALPPGEAGELLPGLQPPDEFRAILNIHYLVEGGFALPGDAPFLGIVGATSQWLFRRGDVASVTVSAADSLIDRPADELAAEIWREIAPHLGREPAPLPPHRVIKEKRATIVQTPAQNARRPGTRTDVSNLFLAGDWIDTGLPATIEGAVRSGQAAAETAINRKTSR